MFDLDPSKLIIIGVVALIVIPSKDLPRVLRTLGQTSARLRRMAREFQDQFSDALRDAEFSDLKNDVERANASLKESIDLGGSFNPMAEARKQISDAIEGKSFGNDQEKEKQHIKKPAEDGGE